jgi:hypothetical protein
MSNENQIMYNNEKLFINFVVFFGEEWYHYRIIDLFVKAFFTRID